MSAQNTPDMSCHDRRDPRVRWRPRPDGLEESVQFTPGYNCREPGWHGHGVHGMEIAWYLRGPLGGAQFKIYTDWTPGPLSPGHGLSPDGSRSNLDHNGDPMYPMGADVGYHSRRPMFEGQEPISDDCPVIGGVCYYDGSGLRAETVARQFVVAGEHVVWTELEEVYARLATEAAEAQRAARSM